MSYGMITANGLSLEELRQKKLYEEYKLTLMAANASKTHNITLAAGQLLLDGAILDIKYDPTGITLNCTHLAYEAVDEIYRQMLTHGRGV